MHIRKALQYLKQTDVHFKDIDFNEVWLNEFCKEQDNEVLGQSNESGKCGEESMDVGEDELLHDRQQHCMFQDVSHACRYWSGSTRSVF